MIEIKVYEILNCFHTKYKDKLVQTHTLKGDTQEDCFHKMYALRRGARYDSARSYQFQESGLEEQYQAWVKKNETIEMFYGSATVD